MNGTRSRLGGATVRCRWMLSLLALALGPLAASAMNTTWVPTGDTWRYLVTPSGPTGDWTSPGFDDSAWGSGPAQLGYGDGDEATVVGFGTDSNAKYITTYFRRAFTVANASAYRRLDLRLVRDDGAVVYLNGIEVYRNNMPAGSIAYSTLASSAIAGTAESQFVSTSLDPAALAEGNNVVAVEIHQSAGNSSDISFDLELGGSDSPVTRGPYLQMGTPTGIVVRWRTAVASDSRVRFGAGPGSLTGVVEDPTVTTEHVVSLSGLSPDTTYYYSVGSSVSAYAGGDSSHTFVTPPLAGTPRATRIWVVGDSGTGDTNALAVRNAYDSFAGTRATDLWLMLGDNAYNSGTDAEYQTAVFETYAQHLRSSVVWPTIGNHDATSADSATQTGPYYDIFTLPTLGQAGGVPSGTEAYYSFDYGNIHFICLDSQETSRQPGSAMLTWLADDLLATNADWTVAFWHHPPYSKGSHDSDTETQLIEMRQNVLPILEASGVDLVLTGHSHSYERSVLLDAHYGLSTTLAGSMILDGGNGRPEGNGAYTKATLGPAPHEGAVYVVAGSSGQVGSGALNHPAMYVSLLSLGSLVLDVNHNALRARFLNSSGAVADSFTLVKGGSFCGNGLRESGEACDQDDLGGAACSTLGCTGGSLACTAACALDSSGCTGCPVDTPTPTATSTPTPTETPSPAPTSTSPATHTPSESPTTTSTSTSTPTPTETPSPVPTSTSPATATPAVTQTQAESPTSTSTPTETGTPTPSAVPTSTSSRHDSVLRPVRPLRVVLPASGEVVKTLAVEVRNADETPERELPGHSIRLRVGVGDCPAATVDSPPDFDLATPGAQDTVLLAGGRAKKARVRLRLRSADFTSHNRLAPQRCTLQLSADHDGSGNEDPTPQNNGQPLELSVVDPADPGSESVHESVLRSLAPVKMTIAELGSGAARTMSVRLTNADILPAPESPGHAMRLGVNEGAGTCPPGTVTVLTSGSTVVAGGSNLTARLAVYVDKARFTSGGSRSPGRCYAELEAITAESANTEPAPANNLTRLVIDVDDRSDY